MGPGRDRTRDPWICSQTRICCQTRYRLRYAARLTWTLPLLRVWTYAVESHSDTSLAAHFLLLSIFFWNFDGDAVALTMRNVFSLILRIDAITCTYTKKSTSTLVTLWEYLLDGICNYKEAKVNLVIITVQSDKRIFVRYYSSVAKMWSTGERVHCKYPHLH